MTGSSTHPRIFMIHALQESVLPAHAAFAAEWPEAETFDLLDTSLAVDLKASGTLNHALMKRFQVLANYAVEADGKGGQTAAILFTCSAFGPAIEAVKQRLSIPVLKPNESAFDAALTLGRRIGLIVTYAPSLSALSAELESMAERMGKTIEVSGVIADGALAALAAGDTRTHDTRAMEAVQELDDVDVVVLGQFSLARAKPVIESVTDVPIITTPGAAVAALKTLCGASSVDARCSPPTIDEHHE